MGRAKDLTGKKFNNLTVIGLCGIGKYGKRIWECECDCGNKTKIDTYSIVSGHNKGCGCLVGKHGRTNNDYKVVDGIAYVNLPNTGNTMLCDADDWEKWKNYYWFEQKDRGYVKAFIDGKQTSYHSHLLEEKDGYVRDHINRNKLDNRKCNLRYASVQANSINANLSKSNTSGYKGVHFDKSNGKWVASITVNYKRKTIGRYKKIEDAIEAREKAEEELHNPIIEKETLQTG